MSELSSRVENILSSTLSGESSNVKPRSRVEILLKQLNSLINELSNATKWIGVTTTALEDGSNTNPITINGSSIVAKEGDITSYNNIEFIFNGTIWQEFGGLYPYISNPSMDGIASPGSSNTWSRGDHVHPSDTSKQDCIKMGSIYLTTSWLGGDPYTQVVTISGVTITPNSKIDVQPTPTQISQLVDDGVISITIENNNGFLTAYSYSSIPSVNMELQCTIIEVE